MHPGDLARVERSLHDVATTVLEARMPEYDPWLYRYCGELAEPADARRYLRYQLDHLALGGVDPRGRSVVDAGCGFGMALVTCGLLGASRLRGIDVHEGMVDTVSAYLPLLPEDLRERMEVVHGDVSSMPYEDESADVLLSIEAISHYLDVEAFVSEARRVLKPGGVMIVSDGNNGLNPVIRRQTREIWRAFELGSTNGDVHGHSVGEPYVEKRARILRASFPNMPEDDVRDIALLTSGMVTDEVVAAGRRRLETGELPDSRFEPDAVPVHPDGQVIERLFDPYALARKIDSQGFSTKVHGYWGGASGKPALRAANRALDAVSRLTIYSARGFRLVAVRAGA